MRITMLKIMTSPGKYVQGYDIIHNFAYYASKLGSRVLVIGGKTALSTVQNKIESGINGNMLECVFIPFTGKGTKKDVADLSAAATDFKADLITGVGGGLAIDTAKAVSDVTYRTVFIDIIYVKDIGYLKNTEGDAIFDEFYSNETGNNSNLLHQNNDKYLLDTTGDGSWNYIYEVPTDTLVAYQEDMTAHIIIALLVLLGIAVFYYIIKTEKYKNLKLSKRLVIRTHGSK